jgi:hypothetical protein
VKENNAEGVHEPGTLDAPIRKPDGIAERVLVQMLPASVQNASPGQRVVSRLREIADQRLALSANEGYRIYAAAIKRVLRKETANL